MKNRIVDQDIVLVPYYPNPKVTLAWYQDYDVCKQVDNINRLYDLDVLNSMYTYLNAVGDLFYIQYRDNLVGDVSLQDNGEISIVVCKEFQNLHIGRRCITEILSLAKEKGMKKVRAKIFSFNTQSRKMFEAIGFLRISEEWYEFIIADD